MQSLNFKQLPTASTLFSTYASVSATAVLLRSAANDLIRLVPAPLRAHITNHLTRLLNGRHTPPTTMTILIEEGNHIAQNELFDASLHYLLTIMGPANTSTLMVSKNPKEKQFSISINGGHMVKDSFDGIDVIWMYACPDEGQYSRSSEGRGRGEGLKKRRLFELSFDKKEKDKVLVSYLQKHVMRSWKRSLKAKKVPKLCTLSWGGPPGNWDSIKLEHPATFETLAMEPELKQAIIDDLDRFVKRKGFYRRVGRAWKRGYLLYGPPPGTGKSSLIAAIANYLKFDIYDLQLGSDTSDAELRRIMLWTTNRSFLVIEDIDCTVEIKNRTGVERPKHHSKQLTRSGMLNFIDGLWSSCDDERIIIFTTNHKDKIDPAPRHPGRMDMHIHMSYLTPRGFKTLTTNYLDAEQDQHPLFDEITTMMVSTNVTPAQVAEELMSSDDPDIALDNVCKLLKRKRTEDEETAKKGAAGGLEGGDNGCFEPPKKKKPKLESKSNKCLTVT